MDGAVSDSSVTDDDDSGVGDGCAIIGGCDSVKVGAEVEVKEDGQGATNASANIVVSEAEDIFMTVRP